MNSSELRNAFLDFFQRNGHEAVSSSPLVPHNDPTLMFTNAGMVQFKNVFTGMEPPPYNRAVTAQKCVRAGGKHNDLDNVGYTPRHHTFFEMLGNFSFGDYFKEDAIKFAWELITKDLGIDKTRLCATVYHTDDEAYDLWKKISGLSEGRIIRIPTSDNFWQMGDTGPCGPCSEIFYDHGDKYEGGMPGTPEENDGSRWVEIWNLVFMQYEQFEDGSRQNLPKPSIDTGMGLERVAALLQGTNDNFETDIFVRLIEASISKTGKKAEGKDKFSHRVIADHLRACSFLIADGVMPSNEGRGYVLRRIMRRAMRHANHLGMKEPLMHQLVPALTSVMGEAYPELIRAEALIRETLKLEEERFMRTLERGLKLLDEEVENIPANGTLAGEIAFKLYDTYGFPVDLTADILRGQNKQVDMQGFEKAMQNQKEEARRNWSGSGEKGTERIWFELKDKVGATEFLGYSVETNEATITAIVKDGAPTDKAGEGDKIQFLTNQTCFYGESGGQIGDTGVLSGKNIEVKITNTTKPLPDVYVHHAVVIKGSLKTGDAVLLAVDHAKRTKLRANHSATHILHKALRKILGEHVTQKGSLVDENKLRFDFSHNKALTSEELEQVEDEVNHIIRQNTHVFTKVMTPEDAVKAGAMALFGEKYGDEVRVVSMGIDGDDHYSLELCGGTHAHHTGDIAVFRITGESSVSAGVRRIEAITGQTALEDIRATDHIIDKIAGNLKSARTEIAARVSGLIEEKKKLEKQVSDLRRQLAMGGSGGGSAQEEIEKINGINFIGRIVDDIPAKDLRGMVDELKKKIESGVVTVISREGGKANVIIGVTADLAARVNAVDLVKSAAQILGGTGGGGRPDMAQAGGSDATKVEEAIEKIKTMVVV